MNGNLNISKAEYNDLKEILELQKTAFISEAELYNDFTIEPLTQTLESIQADFYKYTFLKALYNNEIAGSVKARETGEFCWIGRLIVKPEYQNRGIGKKLLREVETQFPKTSQYLLCTGSKSVKNIRLYESLGYKIIEEITDEKNPKISMVKMIKENSNKETISIKTK